MSPLLTKRPSIQRSHENGDQGLSLIGRRNHMRSFPNSPLLERFERSSHKRNTRYDRGSIACLSSAHHSPTEVPDSKHRTLPQSHTCTCMTTRLRLGPPPLAQRGDGCCRRFDQVLHVQHPLLATNKPTNHLPYRTTYPYPQRHPHSTLLDTTLKSFCTTKDPVLSGAHGRQSW